MMPSSEYVVMCLLHFMYFYYFNKCNKKEGICYRKPQTWKIQNKFEKFTKKKNFYNLF